MKYIDKTKVKIYVFRGAVRLKIENLNFFTRGRINQINNNPSLWEHNNIGANTIVGRLTFGSTESKPNTVGPEPTDLQGRANTMSPAASKVGAKGLLILNALNEGLDMVSKLAALNDGKEVKQHSNLLADAIDDVNKAIDLGMISEEYRSAENISAIINYVFQQENVTDDENIAVIGNRIIEEISKRKNNDER